MRYDRALRGDGDDHAQRRRARSARTDHGGGTVADAGHRRAAGGGRSESLRRQEGRVRDGDHRRRRRSGGRQLRRRRLTMADLVIAGRTFRSRLIVGTGKYPSHQIMRDAHLASGTEMVAVAVPRVDISRKSESLLDYIDTSRIALLPNTAACYTAAEAIRTAHLAREAGLSNWIKLEVIGDPETLFPDNEGLLEATRVLVKEGFVV